MSSTQPRRFSIIFRIVLSVMMLFGVATGFYSGCRNKETTITGGIPVMNSPLIKHIFTADPSAHVFENKLYIYPSHDIDSDMGPSNEGNQYEMRDYHVFSLASMSSPVVDHGLALKLEDIPWALKQLWAPDAALRDNTYYLFFPARDRDGIFRIGIARSDRPEGPFTPEPAPIAGSFSIDPAIFIDDDDQAYLYFGGLWGGQLEKWRTGQYRADGREPDATEPALGPRVVKMSKDFSEFDGAIHEIAILDKTGHPIQSGDRDRRFFEAAWMHKYRGLYYLSYSTGDTHFLVYATGKTPLGPFTFEGRLLDPVSGWTTHHSIVEFQGRWYLFYHDSSLSGVDNKRCVKFTELKYDDNGLIHVEAP